MVGVTDEQQAVPLEIRVLATLTSGPLSVAEVAMRLGEPDIVVSPLLEQGVLDQTVTRIKLTQAPAYSLTPKGLHALGSGGAPEAYAPMPMEQEPAGVAEVSAPEPVKPVELAPLAVQRSSAAGTVVWRHVVYAFFYIVLGLVILIALHSAAIGVVAILAGLALGAWTLRPLLTSS
jgi:hypothetical protein